MVLPSVWKGGVVLLLAAVLSGANKVVMSNVIPHTDPAGNIIDAHDGSIALIDGEEDRTATLSH
jgi:hypothetical protein